MYTAKQNALMVAEMLRRMAADIERRANADDVSEAYIARHVMMQVGNIMQNMRLPEFIDSVASE